MKHQKSRSTTRLRGERLLPLLLVLGFARAEAEQELLFFLSAEGREHTGLSAGETLEHAESMIGADAVYSYNSDRFRLLGEYIYANTEDELERFQIGWEFAEDTMLWLGRFHQPSSYWNTKYHHGQWLQTSISRPGIEDWEDEAGILPAHSTGLLLESGRVVGERSGYELAASVGTGVRLEGSSLEPLDLIEPESGLRATFDFRLAYLPDYLGEDQVGLLAQYSELVVESDVDPDLEQVDLTKIGVYVDWTWTSWRLLSSLLYLDSRLRGRSGSITDSLGAGYAQLEHQFTEGWTLYGRLEDTWDEDSRYLRLFPQARTARQLLGLRWDAFPQHAFTLEIADSKTLSAEFGEIRLQWSAVLP